MSLPALICVRINPGGNFLIERAPMYSAAPVATVWPKTRTGLELATAFAAAPALIAALENLLTAHDPDSGWNDAEIVSAEDDARAALAEATPKPTEA